MKKYIALLLSFIMVFTMIPSIVGPAALAEDPPTPTPEPTPEQTPGPIPDPTGTWVSTTSYTDTSTGDLITIKIYEEVDGTWAFYYRNDDIHPYQKTSVTPEPTPTPTPTPTPEPTPVPVPEHEHLAHIDGKDVLVKYFESLGYVEIWVEGELNETATIADHTPSVADKDIPCFNGTNGIKQMTSLTGLVDPERANFIFHPIDSGKEIVDYEYDSTGPFDANHHPLGWREDLTLADESLGLGIGYYELGTWNYKSSYGADVPISVYRKMHNPVLGLVYEEFNAGTSLGIIMGTIGFFSGWSEAVVFLKLIEAGLIITDVIEVVTSEKLIFNSVKFTYDYTLIDPEGKKYEGSRTVTYKSYIFSKYFNGSEYGNAQDDDRCNYFSVIGDTSLIYQGLSMPDTNSFVTYVLTTYIMPNNHTCVFDNCEDDLDCNICGYCFDAGHKYDWRRLYDANGFDTGHEQYCTRCGVAKPGTQEFHHYTYTYVDNEKCHKACECGLNYDVPHLHDVWHSTPETEEGTSEEYSMCSHCNSPDTRITRPHDLVECDFYDSYWHQPITALEVCLNGGCVRHACRNNCGYFDPFLTDVDSGHINPDGDCICDRCDTPAFHQLKYNQLYEAGGIPKTVHEAYCENCTYIDSGEPHSYGVWTYDNANTCTRQCSKCNISDTASHVHEIWYDISDTVEGSDLCTHCHSANTVITRPHAYFDETDRYCNNGCGRDRYTATDHNYVWSGYDNNGFALNYHYQRCESCGYNNPDQEDHSYGAWVYDNANTCTRQCSKCNISDTASHVHDVWYSISDTEEASMCSNCNSPESIVTRPHVYSDATDRYCNNGCGRDRYTATDHNYEWCGYDDRGFALNYHYQRCESCGYNNPDQEDHSYGAWVYDNTNTCTRRCTKCNVSDTASHVNNVWRTISDTQEESTCSHCNSPNTTITRPHVFFDETARYCDNPGCSYDRYTATNHNYEWTGYDNRGIALSYHYKRCTSCGYNNPDTESHTYSYINVDSDTCRRTCTKCGLSTDFNHSYTNCADRYCNKGCGRDRGLPGVASADGHVYTNCGDLGCNRAGCSHLRTAASAEHQFKWCRLYDNNGFELNVHEQQCETCGYALPDSRESHTYNYTYVDNSTCRKTCSKCGSSTDVPHVYSDCKDTTCYRCDHTSRSSVSGIKYADGHVYTSCTDTLCNRTGCNHTRDSLSHSYTFAWVDVSTSGTCEKNVRTCSVCNDTSVVSYDYSHNYTHYCTSTDCNDCQYVRVAPGHKYTSSWVDVKTASVCEKLVRKCSVSVCGYSYVSSYDYTHAWSSCTDTICNDCGYVRSPLSHSYTYSWVDVRTASTCEKLVVKCSKCGYSYVSTYDYTHAWSSSTDTICNDCGYKRSL